MGLDTTHNAWHGPYSSFNSFRVRLAEIEGFNFDQFCDGKIGLNQIKSGLLPLFNHSDCDGELTPNECKSIAKRLYEIHSILPDAPNDWFKSSVKQFADGCVVASSKGESIEFH